MNRLKKWFYGVTAGIAALFGAHHIQPTQIEQGLPPQVIEQVSPLIPPVLNADLNVPYIAEGNVSGQLDSENEMISQGFLMANKVMASSCFKRFVSDSIFTENLGYQGASLWDKLRANPVAVNVVMFNGTFWQNYGTKTIGYEYQAGTVYMNRHFVDSAYMVADNLTHEGEGHSQGFSHFNKVTSTSEPYGMNKGFELCAESVGIEK